LKVLVINCGSSSLKYQLIETKEDRLMAKGLVERIGIEGSVITHETIGKDKVKTEENMKDHKDAIKHVVTHLTDGKTGAIASMDEIEAVGHRVVHGGEKFSESVLINDEVLKTIEECSDLAPLHNPPNITGIKAAMEMMPGVPMVAVFDTSFHQTMPESSYIYALPYEYYEKYKVRRYGFHGTSHRYIAERAADFLRVDKDKLNVISCHLGNGGSLCAIENGKSVDTSMGFTPLEGLVMGTRCGDIDPAIVTYIMEKENLSLADINNVMNKKSGYLGISGVSSDSRDIEEAAEKGNKRAQLALDVFAKRVKKYIGAYYAEMGRVDAIVFTAGIGENSKTTRKDIINGLECFGVKLDEELNNTGKGERVISTEDSKIKVLVIPTNEELMIARDTNEIVNG